MRVCFNNRDRMCIRDRFKHYLPGNWRIGRNFLNPLYEDSKACLLYTSCIDQSLLDWQITKFIFQAVNLDGFEAVSYTHLDVYKRQIYTGESLKNVNFEQVRGLSAVSYTHLDVYKRKPSFRLPVHSVSYG